MSKKLAKSIKLPKSKHDDDDDSTIDSDSSDSDELELEDDDIGQIEDPDTDNDMDLDRDNDMDMDLDLDLEDAQQYGDENAAINDRHPWITKTITIHVPDEERMGSDLMSVFEYTQLISIRVSQMAKDGIHLVDAKSDNAIDIAKQEIREKRCPIGIIRVMNVETSQDGVQKIYQEYWDPNLMTFNDL